MILRLKQLYYFAAIAIVLTLNISTFAQRAIYRVNDRQMQTLLNRIESRTNTFRESVYQALDNSNINGTNREDSLNSYVKNFENATDALKNNFSNRRSTVNDVQDVLNRAVFINSFMRNNQASRSSQNHWNLIRTDLNTLANYYRVSWDWSYNNNNPLATRPYYVTDSQLKTLLARIEQRGNKFRNDLDGWLDKSRLNGSKREDNFNEYASQFESSTDKLRRNFNEGDSVSADVEEVLRSGSAINSFVTNLRLSNSLQNQWNQIRNDLTTLGSYYRVSWNWNNQNNNNNNNNSNNSFDSRLTGTYRLNINQSDNVANTVRSSISKIRYNSEQRDRTQRNLERRLVSSETIMLEKRGNEVMLASTNVPQVSFTADGTTYTETNNNGRTTKVRASSNNNDLTISYEGDQMNDFDVSFMPMNNNQLKISRKVFLENRNQTVMVNSVYDKIDQTPRWNTTANTNSNNNETNNFLISNNTRLTATLDNQITTKTARNSDRFTMTVNSPSQYNGAIIEGRVIGEKSGVVSGNATLSLSFETIRLRNGTSYRFAGIVEQVRMPNGNIIGVNNEGTVRDGSQTTKTVTRAGIGAILGAIIGAVVDGGQGAAIGAGIGAGAGAGSVVLQGRDNLDLPNGTEFIITATASNNVVNNR